MGSIPVEATNQKPFIMKGFFFYFLDFKNGIISIPMKTLI